MSHEERARRWISDFYGQAIDEKASPEDRVALKDLASLLAAVERETREACAKECEAEPPAWRGYDEEDSAVEYDAVSSASRNIAARIRRGGGG